MGKFKKLRSWVFDDGKKKEATKPKKKELSEKEKATAAGEAWVDVISFSIEDDMAEGSFEIDWNDIFVAHLLKAGYKGKTDQDIVDNWFNDVCKNVVAETYQQAQADPEKRAKGNRTDLGDGKSEYR